MVRHYYLWIWLAICSAGCESNTPDQTATRIDSGARGRDASQASADSGIATSVSDAGGDPGVDGSLSLPDGAIAADSGPPASPDAARDSGYDAGPVAPPPRCITQGSQVVALGDSYVSYRGPATDLTPLLSALARRDGVITGLDSFRNYAIPGASMHGPGLDNIPLQLPRATQADPDIRAIFMTGGGNDVLIGAHECTDEGSSMSQACREVVETAVETARQMLLDAADAGVRDVVYFFYPDIIPGAWLSGAAPNEILGYAYPMARATCEEAFVASGGRTRCYFIDLRPVFQGHTMEWISPLDGVHPEPAGAEAIARAIWDTMKANCIAQPASSGCCEVD